MSEETLPNLGALNLCFLMDDTLASVYILETKSTMEHCPGIIFMHFSYSYLEVINTILSILELHLHLVERPGTNCCRKKKGPGTL